MSPLPSGTAPGYVVVTSVVKIRELFDTLGFLAACRLPHLLVYNTPLRPTSLESKMLCVS